MAETKRLDNGHCQKNAKACQIPIKKGIRLLGWRTGCCAGKVIDLMELVRAQLGFTYTLYIVADGKWGSNLNGTWNGMIKDVVDGKADFVLQHMNLMENRFKVVDYTPSLETTSYGIMRIKNLETNIPNWGFLNQLSFELEVAIVVATVLAVAMIILLENAPSMIDSKRFER